MSTEPLPSFPYGAVYFRKSNPPAADWARDYRVAAEDGMNVFRHWCLWSAVEVAPGVYDWTDYDCQLDLAAEHGLKTVLAEMITAAPEWAFRAFDHARLEARTGQRAGSGISGSCVTGGFPGLCLDATSVREQAERFLRAMVLRYRDHPALGGYDVWNECNYPAAYCYCPATALSRDGRYLYYVPGTHAEPVPGGPAIVQMDTRTAARKVLAFLQPVLGGRLGYRFGTPYSIALDSIDSSLLVTWNGRRTGGDGPPSAVGEPAFTYVEIPVGERPADQKK